MTHDQATPVVVVGAGLSGLACADALARRNIPVTIVEAEDRVAEPWRRRHPQLRLNIHRHFAQLPGRPMAADDGAFVCRDTLVRYLEDYAAELPATIDYGVEVRRVERGESHWALETSRGARECAHLIFATGRDSVPHIPDWPGREGFGGEFLHAADLGDVARFNGKSVLVIGAGNSGGDVLNHLARHAPAKVFVSVRHGPAIVPERVFGFPLHRAANLFAALPLWLVDPAFRLTERLFLGNLRRYGLTAHTKGGGTRLVEDGVAFAVDDGFVAAVKAGRFNVRGPVSRFDGDRVVFGDGRFIQPDVVIAATGYRTGLTPLLGRLGVLDDRGQPLRPAGEADPDNPGLWFAGYRPVFQGYFHAARAAAVRIADGILATAEAPVALPTNRQSPLAEAPAR
jgi:cation diffusion facilitator CzcD-associated flavoprotein CzcO